jgi:hypothetical protein
MSSEQNNASIKRSSILFRFIFMILAGLISLLFSAQALFRSMLCLCPSQFLATAGLFISGAGLIIYGIHMIIEDIRLRKIAMKIDNEDQNLNV